ncbi:hypothetical protein [Pseudomonas marginalis]|uniref:hypothetical protein n=1 Tax=Pseudomonas marginalis TaxID=298 RepID=UPI0034D45E26
MAAKKTGFRGHTPPPKGAEKPIPREQKVTAEQLVDHLNSINPDSLCTFCGVGEYAVPSDPEGKTASMVAAPIPYLPGVGLWLYTAVCTNCSHVVFFHAPFTAAKIIKE